MYIIAMLKAPPDSPTTKFIKELGTRLSLEKPKLTRQTNSPLSPVIVHFVFSPKTTPLK